MWGIYGLQCIISAGLAISHITVNGELFSFGTFYYVDVRCRVWQRVGVYKDVDLWEFKNFNLDEITLIYLILEVFKT